MSGSSPAVRLKAIEISVGLLRRQLLVGADSLARGGGSLWSIRKRANKALVEIYGQMAALGAECRPRDESKVRGPKKGDADGNDQTGKGTEEAEEAS